MSLFEQNRGERAPYIAAEKWWGCGAAAFLAVSGVLAVGRYRWRSVVISAIGVPVLIALYIRASKLQTIESWKLFGNLGFGLFMLDQALYLLRH